MSPMGSAPILENSDHIVESALAGKWGQCESDAAAAPVDLFRNVRNPSVPVHNLQRSGQSGAVHCENFSEPPLCEFSSERERLKDAELRDRESQRPQRLVIALGKRPGSAANIGAHARKSRCGQALHVTKDVYACHWDSK